MEPLGGRRPCCGAAARVLDDSGRGGGAEWGLCFNHERRAFEEVWLVADPATFEWSTGRNLGRRLTHISKGPNRWRLGSWHWLGDFERRFAFKRNYFNVYSPLTKLEYRLA